MDRLLKREVSVERTADRLAYLVLSFGLLAVVAYRSFVDRVASWDLLALVVLGGFVGAAYRFRQGVLSRESALVLGVTVLIALAVGAIVVLGLRS